MKAGELRHRIAIQAPDVVETTSGDPVPTWVHVEYRWAAIEPVAGREYWFAQATNTEVTHRVTLRGVGLDYLDTSYRLVYRERPLHISAILDTEERGTGLQLLCIERGA